MKSSTYHDFSNAQILIILKLKCLFKIKRIGFMEVQNQFTFVEAFESQIMNGRIIKNSMSRYEGLKFHKYKKLRDKMVILKLFFTIYFF